MTPIDGKPVTMHERLFKVLDELKEQFAGTNPPDTFLAVMAVKDFEEATTDNYEDLVQSALAYLTAQ